MIITKIAALSQQQKEAVLDLWNNEYPEKLLHKDTKSLEDHFSKFTDQSHYLALEEYRLVGWAFDFIRDNERWFAIIVSAGSKGKGVGSKLINQLKENNKQLSGWVMDNNDALKANGEYYKSPLKFYLKNDFVVIPEVRLETEKMSAVKIVWRRDGMHNL